MSTPIQNRILWGNMDSDEDMGFDPVASSSGIWHGPPGGGPDHGGPPGGPQGR